MMPLYEFTCEHCDGTDEVLLTVEARDDGPTCCSTPMVRIWSTPRLGIWNSERKFPNLKKAAGTLDDGAMSFQSKSSYESYLSENHLAEVSQGGIVERPHGNRVVYTDGKSARSQPARRARAGAVGSDTASPRRSNAKQRRRDPVERG